ncbi:MAG: AMP-binding protein [Polyangiaceae bacterium]|nr:AMP-binding protein [Polyangiaceae bacterium]
MLPALFAARASATPHAPAFFVVSFHGHQSTATAHSWANVERAARRAASALAGAGVVRGDRVVLSVSEAPEFLAFFLGAQGLGAIPVPLPSVADVRARDAFRARVDSVVRDCSPAAIVVDGPADALPDGHGSRVVSAAAANADPGDGPVPASFTFQRSPREIAFIQYTSGSTCAPKGVLVTHANLMANLRSIAAAADLGPGDVGFNWLPLYHDMGLIGGLLFGLYCGGNYVMSTRAFIGAPGLWLRAMSDYKATFAAAPNFAFSLLAKHVRDEAIVGLDLSHWRRAFNGSEPIDRATVDAFVTRFRPAGFRAETMCPVYGLAEATLAVAFTAPDSAPRYDFVQRYALMREGRARPAEPDERGTVCFVGAGRAVPDTRVKIVDPSSGAELPERRVGEVVVLGPSVTLGYYGRDQVAQRELRTGDLGYLADGELFIVDRLKDLLIISGRNIIPSDVERTVARVAGVRYGAVVAFATRGSEGTDELIVVAGATPRALRDPRTHDEIKSIVYQHFQVMPRAVALVPPSMVPRTSSGKLQRSACRALYESGAYTGKFAS